MQQDADNHINTILHLHGPGGIGKTTLLRRFAAGLSDGNCLYVDDHTQLPGALDPAVSDGPNAGGDKARLNRIADSLHERADRSGGLVLAIDGFEPWSPAADWMRERLLPLVHPDKIKLVTAGRQPLTGRWQENGWQHLVSNLAVTPLEPADIRSYAAIRGIVSGSTPPGPLDRMKKPEAVRNIPDGLGHTGYVNESQPSNSVPASTATGSSSGWPFSSCRLLSIPFLESR